MAPIRAGLRSMCVLAKFFDKTSITFASIVCSLKAAKPKTLASGTKRTVTTLHTAEPSTSKAATPVIRRPRNKAKLKADLEKNKLMNKIAETIKKHNGQPALYASTTKGGMKLIYDGHHFRYSFRKGQYSIFQCCYKESKEECKVRVVSDQKRVYPLDGEHVHFMQATDRSVTSMTFEPGEAIEEMELQQQKQKEEQEHFLSDDTYDLQLVTITEDGNIVPLHESGQVVVKSDVDDAPTTPTVVSVTEPADRKPDQAALDAIDADDFREKIKRRLQKALLGKKK